MGLIIQLRKFWRSLEIFGDQNLKFFIIKLTNYPLEVISAYVCTKSVQKGYLEVQVTSKHMIRQVSPASVSGQLWIKLYNKNEFNFDMIANECQLFIIYLCAG